jgi:hypothetical protein
MYPAAITRGSEEMKAKGFGGALICDAGVPSRMDNARVPHGPTNFTPDGGSFTGIHCAKPTAWDWK